jgi:actin related protein 2/3 complex subunit 2
VDINFVDYDNVRFHLSTPTSKTQLVLSMGIQCWGDLAKYGVNNMLESEYGEWLIRDGPEKEQEYDVSLLIDLEKIPEDDGGLSAILHKGDPH